MIRGDKDSAKIELKQVLIHRRYSLDANNDGKVDVEDYAYLFAHLQKNCKSLFWAQFLSGVDNVNGYQINILLFFGLFISGSSDAFREEEVKILQSKDLLAEYEENDPRMNLSIVQVIKMKVLIFGLIILILASSMILIGKTLDKTLRLFVMLIFYYCIRS